MTSPRTPPCTVKGIDMAPMRNRNEKRVATCIQAVCDSMGAHAFSDKDLQDVYAYSLNHLPARYTQPGTIVLRDPISKQEIQTIVQEGFEVIRTNPKP